MAAYLLFNDKPIRGSAGVQRVLTCLSAEWTGCCELIQLGCVSVNYSSGTEAGIPELSPRQSGKAATLEQLKGFQSHCWCGSTADVCAGGNKGYLSPG